MLYEEQTPPASNGVIWLRWVGLTVLGGVAGRFALLSLLTQSFIQPGILFYLALPLFLFRSDSGFCCAASLPGQAYGC